MCLVGPGVINACTGPLSYEVRVGPDSIWRRHIDQLLDAETGKSFAQQLEMVPDILPPVVPETIGHQTSSDPLIKASSSPGSSSLLQSEKKTQPTAPSTITGSPSRTEHRYPLRTLLRAFEAKQATFCSLFLFSKIIVFGKLLNLQQRLLFKQSRQLTLSNVCLSAVYFQHLKVTFINTPDSFSTPIGGQRVTWGCLNG